LTGAGGGLAEARSAGSTASSRPDPLAGWVFAALVLACLVAFFVTQRLKHTPTAVQDFKLTSYFSPFPSGHLKLEAISFKIAHADEVTVEILDSRDNTVATLVRDRPVARYKQFSLRWNGRRGSARRYSHIVTAAGRRILVAEPAGPLAAAGEYRVGVSLLGRGQRLLLPRSFALVKP
jgi:hypothetical protein